VRPLLQARRRGSGLTASSGGSAGSDEPGSRARIGQPAYCTSRGATRRATRSSVRVAVRRSRARRGTTLATTRDSMRAPSRAGIAVARTNGERTSSAARRAVASGRVPASGPPPPPSPPSPPPPPPPHLPPHPPPQPPPPPPAEPPAAPRAPGSARAASSRAQGARASRAAHHRLGLLVHGPCAPRNACAPGVHAVSCRSVTKTYLVHVWASSRGERRRCVLASRVLHVDGTRRGLAAVVAMHAPLRRAALTVSFSLPTTTPPRDCHGDQR
jgi:hypothetical protein